MNNLKPCNNWQPVMRDLLTCLSAVGCSLCELHEKTCVEGDTPQIRAEKLLKLHKPPEPEAKP